MIWVDNGFPNNCIVLYFINCFKFIFMKKMLMIAAAGLMIAGMSSCKKDYTCTCTAAGVTIFGVTTPDVSSSTTIKDTKSNAKSTCEGASMEGVTCVID